MRLSAIVPATDDPPTLERCLAAIEAAERSPEEVIAVTEPPGFGPAAARNEGARRAGGEVLVFVDADVLVHGDAFARIRDAFAAQPALTALFGAYDDSPEAPGAVAGFRNLLHHWVHSSGGGGAETFWAGLGAVRRDAFEASGGFDAGRYPHPSIEDVELGMRLAAAGAAIRLDPAIRGTHLKDWGLADMVRTDFARRGVPWARLVLDSGTPSTALNLGWRHRLSAAASAVAAAAVLARRPRATLAALIALLALNLPFYSLLLRRRGARQAALGVGLHAVHHLTGVAAAGAALLGRGRRG